MGKRSQPGRVTSAPINSLYRRNLQQRKFHFHLWPFSFTMARLAVTFTLIFSLFLLPQAHRLQPNQQPENLLLKSIPSTSNPLPDLLDSASKVAIFPSHRIAESEPIEAAELRGSNLVAVFSHGRLQPNPPENQVVEWKHSSTNELPDSSSKLELLPSKHPTDLALFPEKPKEDVVPSEIVAKSESTDAVELPGSDVITVADLTITSETATSSINEYGFHFQFPFGFHFHSHCNHQGQEEKNKKHSFHFGFRFPYVFHFHSHCQEGKKEMEKKFEPRIAGEEIPNVEEMIKARTAGFLDGRRVHNQKPVGVCEGMMKMEEGKNKKVHKKGWKKEKEEGEVMMRFEEGKRKHHKKEWKKEKGEDEEMVRFEEGKMKHHKKEWRKEKEYSEGVMRVRLEEEKKMKRHQKEWKKEKEDGEGKMKRNKKEKEWTKKKEEEEEAGLKKLFRKFFKHLRKHYS